MSSLNYKYILFAAIAVGTSHVLTWAIPMDKLWVVLWKGASVGLLAVFAAFNAKNLDGWLLTLVLLLSAISDVLIVTIGSNEGGLAFIIADLLAIWLYARNIAPLPWSAGKLAPLAIVPCASLFGYLIVTNRAEAANIGLFVVPLATMAAFAWMSRFPRQLTALGAFMILSSDLLIFARQGPLDGIPELNFVVWLSYFLGETLVCIGVIKTLSHFDTLKEPAPLNISQINT